MIFEFRRQHNLDPASRRCLLVPRRGDMSPDFRRAGTVLILAHTDGKNHNSGAEGAGSPNMPAYCPLHRVSEQQPRQVHYFTLHAVDKVVRM